MSSLTAEQVRELTQRINERFAEFDIAMSRLFERVTPGVVRLVFDVVEEWTAKAAATKYLAYEAAIDEDEPSGRDDGFAEFEAFWPAMPDLQGGADLFAEHPVAGGPEPERTTKSEFIGVRMEPEQFDAMMTAAKDAGVTGGISAAARWVIDNASLPDPAPTNGNGHHADELELSTATVVTLGAAHTGGNGHHAELSPATSATLGPEHTVVTPLIPRRPRTLAEVDGIDMEDGEEGRLSRPGARAKKELDELRAKAAARARLGEVSREQMIAELKRQAMAGAMPTQDQFDIAKPAVWPKAQMLTERFDASWTDLAREAGLRLVRR